MHEWSRRRALMKVRLGMINVMAEGLIPDGKTLNTRPFKH